MTKNRVSKPHTQPPVESKENSDHDQDTVSRYGLPSEKKLDLLDEIDDAF